MLKRLAFAVLAVAVLGGFARAQEAEDEEIAKREPVRKIKVLENPYDIASFYRSPPGRGYFGYEQGPGRQPVPDRELLPLASDRRVRVRVLLEQRLQLRHRGGGPASAIGGASARTATCSCSRPPSSPRSAP